jgi:hypothetical protein
VKKGVPVVGPFLVFIFACDLPGPLVTVTDYACAVLRFTVEREIFSGAILDAEEAITSIFESPLRTR